jgi:hypothetical protein
LPHKAKIDPIEPTLKEAVYMVDAIFGMDDGSVQDIFNYPTTKEKSRSSKRERAVVNAKTYRDKLKKDPTAYADYRRKRNEAQRKSKLKRKARVAREALDLKANSEYNRNNSEIESESWAGVTLHPLSKVTGNPSTQPPPAKVFGMQLYLNPTTCTLLPMEQLDTPSRNFDSNQAQKVSMGGGKGPCEFFSYHALKETNQELTIDHGCLDHICDPLFDDIIHHDSMDLSLEDEVEMINANTYDAPKASSVDEETMREKKRERAVVNAKTYKDKLKKDPKAWANHRRKGNSAQRKSKLKREARAKLDPKANAEYSRRIRERERARYIRRKSRGRKREISE